MPRDRVDLGHSRGHAASASLKSDRSRFTPVSPLGVGAIRPDASPQQCLPLGREVLRVRHSRAWPSKSNLLATPPVTPSPLLWLRGDLVPERALVV
jgi:hypothetical protein